MSLKDTYKQMRDLLAHITGDLEKSENGNKAASQRVRTGTVKLEKIGKLYRKESISSEKKTKGNKKPSKSTGTKTKAAAHHHAAAKSKPKAKSAAHKPKAAAVKAKPKAKAAHARTSVRPRQLSMKRATAKLPTRRVSAR